MLAKVPSNVFLTLALSLLERGEDGELIVRELVEAFRAIAAEASDGSTPEEEFARLSQDLKEE